MAAKKGSKGRVLDFTKGSRLVPIPRSVYEDKNGNLDPRAVSPSEEAKPKTIRDFYELSYLGALVGQGPPPKPDNSPFSSKEEKQLSSIFTGPNGSIYFDAVNRLVAASDSYFDELLEKARKTSQPEFKALRDKIRRVCKHLEALSQALSDLPGDLCMHVGYDLDSSTPDQRQWRNDLIGSLDSLRQPLGSRIPLSPRGMFGRRGPRLDYKYFLVANIIAKAMAETGKDLATNPTGLFIGALSYCIEVGAGCNQKLKDKAFDRAIHIARTFIPTWDLGLKEMAHSHYIFFATLAARR